MERRIPEDPARTVEFSDAAVAACQAVAFREERAVEADFIWTISSIVVEAAAWLSVGAVVLAPSARACRGARTWLLGMVVVLGVFVVTAACCHAGCGLSAGFTIVVVLVAVLGLPVREWRVDPYALIYPLEERLAPAT